MTTTILHHDEWSRLSETGAAALVSTLHPDRAIIVAVEEGGRIVGTWTFLTVPHLEGFWVHPDHQGKATVLRHLITRMQRLTKENGASVVMTGADSDQVRVMLERAGATKAPEQFYLPTNWRLS